MIWTDCLSKQWAGRVGVLLLSPKGNKIECAVCLQFSRTNNEPEYEVVLWGLNLAKVARATLVVIHYDSEVVVGHINGDYEAKGERMREYLSMTKRKVNEGLSAKFV